MFRFFTRLIYGQPKNYSYTPEIRSHFPQCPSDWEGGLSGPCGLYEEPRTCIIKYDTVIQCSGPCVKYKVPAFPEAFEPVELVTYLRKVNGMSD